MKATIRTISPRTAAKWLEKNDKNRRLSKSAAQRIAADILAGRWAVNGQAIIFDTNGVLVDGQHRLAACVEAGVPIRSVVVSGVDPTVFVTIDTGAGSRTFAHVCDINGEKNAKLLAAVAKIAWRHARGKTLTSIKPSNTDLELFLEGQPRLREAAEVGSACRYVGQGSVLGFCYFIFSGIDRPKAEAFFASLESGANLGARSPVLHLRNKLLDAKRSRLTRLNPPAQIYLTFRAWVAYLHGKSMRRLILPKDGVITLPDPRGC